MMEGNKVNFDVVKNGGFICRIVYHAQELW